MNKKQIGVILSTLVFGAVNMAYAADKAEAPKAEAPAKAEKKADKKADKKAGKGDKKAGGEASCGGAKGCGGEKAK